VAWELEIDLPSTFQTHPEHVFEPIITENGPAVCRTNTQFSVGLFLKTL
jgi:hypothetical protein